MKLLKKKGKNGVFVQTATYILFGVVFMCSATLIGVYAGGLYGKASGESLISASKDIEERSPLQPAGVIDKTNASIPDRLLMIDPGHGGEDGGASSDGGLVEKDVNLAVSENISSLCLLFGVPSDMTRCDDRLLYDKYDDLEDYKGKKKSYDLKNRLRATEESEADLFLSVHMNKFSDPKYSGLQVYYSPGNDDSEKLAGVVQSYVKNHLQPQNNREAKKAGSSIYLLDRMSIPAILVECGFLSNPEESSLLSQSEYRAKLSVSVFVPLLEYFSRMSA